MASKRKLENTLWSASVYLRAHGLPCDTRLKPYIFGGSKKHYKQAGIQHYHDIFLIQGGLDGFFRVNIKATKDRPEQEACLTTLREAVDMVLQAYGKLPDSGIRRVGLEFSSEAYEKLQTLRTTASAGSNAEVVREALRLYEWYLGRTGEGYKIQLVKDGEAREVELTF